MSGGSQPFGAFEAVVRRNEMEQTMRSASAPARRRWRVLLIANETCADPSLCIRVRNQAGHGAEALVVAPVPNLRNRDEAAAARRAAEVRLTRCVATLAELGLHPSGEVADTDPVRALQDALVTFAADEVIIATYPAERSNWLASDLVETAQTRLRLPVTHMVVDAPTPAHSGEAR